MPQGGGASSSAPPHRSLHPSAATATSHTWGSRLRPNRITPAHRRSIYIVEIKRKETIDREIIQEIDACVKAIRRPDGVSIRTALVYDGNLSPVVAADGYFDAIVPFKKLLGL